MEFRALTEKEVECRLSYVGVNGVSLLLYKDARVDMRMLDEAVGPLNWQRRHELIGDRLYCTVSVWDVEKGQWISKQDVGTESYTEKEKGQASDAFKRACFNLGIGRELYTAPSIWIDSKNCKIEKDDRRGAWACKERFAVSRMTVESGEITALEIINSKTKRTVYTFGVLTDDKIDEAMYKALQARCKAAGKSLKAIMDGRKPSEVTVSEFRQIMDSLGEQNEG